MGRYQEQVARRNARYEYEIPDGALQCELVSGTEPVEDDEGKTVGVRTWRGIRYLLRLDPEPEAWSPVAVFHVVGPIAGPYPAPPGMAWSGTYAPDGSPLGEPVLVPVPGFPVSEHMAALAVAKVLGEALMRTRLALTALDVGEVEFDSAVPEAQGILAALCALLVEAGAVDPMEVD